MELACTRRCTVGQNSESMATEGRGRRRCRRCRIVVYMVNSRWSFWCSAPLDRETSATERPKLALTSLTRRDPSYCPLCDGIHPSALGLWALPRHRRELTLQIVTTTPPPPAACSCSRPSFARYPLSLSGGRHDEWRSEPVAVPRRAAHRKPR